MENEIVKLNNQIATLQGQVNHLNDLFFRIFFIDKAVFQNPVYFNGNVIFKTINFFKDTTIQTGTATGAKIGATGDKIGFMGATPIVRAGAISAPATQGATYSQTDVQSIVTAVNSIRTVLTNFGLTS